MNNPSILEPIILGYDNNEHSQFFKFCECNHISVHTVALSIDRWIAVDYALNYHSIMSPFCLKLLVAASWILGSTETLVLTLAQVFVEKNQFLGNRTISMLFVIHLAVILFINAVIYSKLWSVARRQRRQIAQLQQQQDNSTGVNKATVMVMVIVVVFVLLWGP